MGKSTPSAPAAPDPAVAAKAQGAANLETAIAQGYLNATNQVTPYGNVTFDKTSDVQVGDKTVPRFTSTTTLSPSEQAKFDLQSGLENQALGLGKNVLGNVGDAISQPFNLDGLPQAPGTTDFTADRDKVVRGIIDRQAPQFQRQEDAMRNRLANQGISEGSQAYSAAVDDFSRGKNDFDMAALNAGSAEQSRLFGMGQQERQQGIQERAYERSQPINEYATLLGLGGNVQVPSFDQPQTGVAPTDVMGAYNMQNQANIAQYNAQAGTASSNNQAVGGLASAAAMAAMMF